MTRDSTSQTIPFFRGPQTGQDAMISGARPFHEYRGILMRHCANMLVVSQANT